MIETKNENKLKIYLDKIINNAEVIDFLGNTKFLKFKEERNFEFYSVDERNDFVGLMRRNYYMLTNKFIKIDCYPSLNKKRLGSKATIETISIFDSSFESSEEEQKTNEKEKDLKIEDKKDSENNNEIKENNNIIEEKGNNVKEEEINKNKEDLKENENNKNIGNNEIINKNEIKEINKSESKGSKKKLKKTKKSIFDDKYNSIFDSDYESEEDN